MKETTGTLTNTTVAVAANVSRLGIIVANLSDTVMTYHPNGTASATAGIVVPAGQNIILVGDQAKGLITSAGTVFCAGTSKAYSIFEW